MKIFKYKIPLNHEFVLDLPIDSRILTFQVQKDEMFIWVMQEPTLSKIQRCFELVGTGHEYYPSKSLYIGTVQLDGFVWHLFEKLYDRD